jgi:hypothetical protein
MTIEGRPVTAASGTASFTAAVVALARRQSLDGFAELRRI